MDGKQVEFAVGDDTPTNSGAYAKVAGDPHVYTVASYVKTSLDKTVNDLRDKRLLTFDSDKLTRVKLAAKGPAIVFGKNGQNEWQIVEPRPLRADSGQVEALLGKLRDAKMDLGTAPDEAAKKFAAAATVALAQSPITPAPKPWKFARTRTIITMPGAPRWPAFTRSRRIPASG